MKKLINRCVNTNDIVQLKTLIENGFDINKNGNAILIKAVSYDKIIIVEFLLSLGINPNISNILGNTPLHMSGNYAIIELLIKYGANTNTVNNDKNTPLHLYTKYNYNIKIIQLLINSGAHINVVNIDGNTPLHITNNYGTALLLINSGANVNMVNNKGNTPLHVMHNYSIIVELISFGANVNTVNNEGNTPLHITNDYDIMSKLIIEGADVNKQNNYGDTPLHVATIRHNIRIIRCLLCSGADANAVNLSGNTPLHNLAMYRNDNIISLFFCYAINIKINATNNNGDTPIMLASKRSDWGDRYHNTSIFVKLGATYDNIQHNNLILYETNLSRYIKGDTNSILMVTDIEYCNYYLLRILASRGEINIINQLLDTYDINLTDECLELIIKSLPPHITTLRFLLISKLRKNMDIIMPLNHDLDISNSHNLDISNNHNLDISNNHNLDIPDHILQDILTDELLYLLPKNIRDKLK